MAQDPANPNRPHHPLVTTTKANFPPRQPKRKSVNVKRSSSISSRGASATPAKRVKVEGTVEPEAGAAKPETGDDASGPSRPKRQAALNRPDYHALHHHIATPTGKWLRLIADPEKYNTTILDGKLSISRPLPKLTPRGLSENTRRYGDESMDRSASRPSSRLGTFCAWFSLLWTYSRTPHCQTGRWRV